MANVKKLKGILLLDKQKIDCSVFPFQTVVTFSFPQTSVRNMDVVDSVSFQNALHDFLQKNKVPLSSFILVLQENILFEKQVVTASSPTVLTPHAAPVAAPQVQKAPPPAAGTQPAHSGTVPPPVQPQPSAIMPDAESKVTLTPEQQREAEEKAIQHFIDSVPFEEVLHTTMKIPNGKTVVATNKDLIENIRKTVEKEGSSLEGVFPMTVFRKEITVANGFTPEVLHQLLAKSDTVKEQNMLLTEKKQNESPAGTVTLTMPQKDSDKKRLYVMIGVFGVLVIVMVLLFMRMNAENEAIRKKSAKKKMTPVAATIVPSVTPLPETIPASSSAMPETDLTILITSGEDTASIAATLRQQLGESGFSSVTTRQAGTSAQRSLIIFSQDVSEDTRAYFLEVVAGSITTPVVQETTTGEKSVFVTL